jgi:hypothetical protein
MKMCYTFKLSFGVNVLAFFDLAALPQNWAYCIQSSGHTGSSGAHGNTKLRAGVLQLSGNTRENK